MLVGCESGQPEADARPVADAAQVDALPEAEPSDAASPAPDLGCLPSAETCDGTDQDCDGLVDEALDAPCFEGPEGAAGVGLCLAGRRTCVEGRWGGCEGQALPADETCDGADEDCDGAVDEDTDLSSDPANCGACGGRCAQPGAVTECREGACSRVACEAGRADCNADAGDGCETEGECPPDALCDGVDEDGDGRVDEGYVAVEVCGEGACRAGALPSRCERGRVVDCVAGPRLGAVDGCDGVDADCDGLMDEDFSPEAGCGVGACAARPSRCEAGGVVACSRGPAPREGDARCDGVDEDCDGRVDEDYSTTLSCGLGRCARRATPSSCRGGMETACAPGEAALEDAACDGIDEDCDGALDEDCEGGPRAPRLVVIEDAVAERAAIEPGGLQITFARVDVVPVVPGEVLASQVGEGLLLLVESVEGPVVRGRRAALDEVAGEAQAQVHLEFSLARVADEGLPQQKHFQDWGRLVMLGERRLGTEATLRDVQVAFDVDLSLDVELCGYLCVRRVHLFVERIVIFEAGLELGVDGAATFTREAPLFADDLVSRSALLVGPAPLVAQLEANLDLALDVEAEGALGWSSQLRLIDESAFELSWSEARGWQSGNEWRRRAGSAEAAPDPAAPALIRFALRPSFGLRGSGSPGLSTRNTLSAATTLGVEPLGWSMEVCAHLETEAAAPFVSRALAPQAVELGSWCGDAAGDP